MKLSQTEVEFFGINFGIKPWEVCTKCGSEYLENEVIQAVQDAMKKLGLFGLERNLQITKSGNSLVIRIPKDVADFLEISHKSLIKLFPTSKRTLQIEVLE